MILPTIAAVSQDALTAVPMKTKQAAYGMGTTHWEAILKVMVPSAATGISARWCWAWAVRWVKPWPWPCW
jgi:ABC-type phosphate transport system permease subunit